MTDAKTREAVKNMYPNSETWASRVDRMPMYQVTAIYLSTLQRTPTVKPLPIKETKKPQNETLF